MKFKGNQKKIVLQFTIFCSTSGNKWFLIQFVTLIDNFLFQSIALKKNCFSLFKKK